MFSLPVLNVARIDAVYERLPKVACKGLCQGFCGPVLATEVEWKRLLNSAGRGETPPLGEGLTCPFLTNAGRCSVYDARPYVCRAWGAVPSLPCPFGCEPDRKIGRAEEKALFREVLALGKIGRRLRLMGTGTKPLAREDVPPPRRPA